MTITKEMREAAGMAVFERSTSASTWTDLANYALDALATMPEPGCEGCKWVHDDGYKSPCQRCTRGNGGDFYSPRDSAR